MKHFIMIATLVATLMSGMTMSVCAKPNNATSNSQTAQAVKTTDAAVAVPDTVASDSAMALAIEMKKLELQELKAKQGHEKEMSFDSNLLIPILGIVFCGALLPITIVFLVVSFSRRKQKERAELLRLMIEKDQDVTSFIEAENKPQEQMANVEKIFIWGLVIMLVGVGFIIVTIIRGDGQFSPFTFPVAGVGLALVIGSVVARRWRKNNQTDIDVNDVAKNDEK